MTTSVLIQKYGAKIGERFGVWLGAPTKAYSPYFKEAQRRQAPNKPPSLVPDL